MTEPATCPICGRPSAQDRTAPFCSRRCADVDLGRWFTESYRLPDRSTPPDPVDPEDGVG